MLKKLFSSKTMAAFFAALFCTVSPAFASEADLVVPSIKDANPDFFNYLLIGIAISVIGLVFGFIEFLRIKSLTFTRLWLKSETQFLKPVKLT